MKGGCDSFASSAREQINPTCSYPSFLSVGREEGTGVTDYQQERAGLIEYAPWHELEEITVTRYKCISRFTMHFLRFSVSPDNWAEKFFKAL